MKRFCALLFGLFFLLTAACGEKEPLPASSAPEASSVESGGTSSVPEKEPEKSADSQAKLVALAAGDRNLPGVSGGSGYYTLEEVPAEKGEQRFLQILYLDYASHTSMPLCTKKGCAHNTAQCTACFAEDEGFSLSQTLLFLYRGKLYVLGLGDMLSGGNAPVLYSVETDGSGKARQLALEDGIMIEELCAADGDWLYLIVNRAEEKNAVNGDGLSVGVSEISQNLLVALNLKEKTYHTAGSMENKIVYGVFDGRLAMGELDKKGYRIFLLNPVSGAEETVYREVGEGLPQGVLSGEKLYVQLERRIGCLNLKSGEMTSLLKISAGEILLEGMWENRLLYSVYENYVKDVPPRELRWLEPEAGKDGRIDFLSRSSGEKIQILSAAENGFLLLTGRERLKNDEGIRYYANQYAWVPKEELWKETPQYLPFTAGSTLPTA